MRRARATSALVMALVAVLLMLGYAESSRSSPRDSGWDEVAGYLRERARHSAGKQLVPESLPLPTIAVLFAGREQFEVWRDRYRVPSRYGDRVPPRDTSPAVLQIFRC